MSVSSINKSDLGSLRIVPCPQCGVDLLRLWSKTEDNPGRIFYKCPNNNRTLYKLNMQKFSKCKFFMWGEQYKEYLSSTDEAETVTVPSEIEFKEPETNVTVPSSVPSGVSNGQQSDFQRIDQQLHEMMMELKRRNVQSELIGNIEKIKLVLISILFVLVSIWIVELITLAKS